MVVLEDTIPKDNDEMANRWTRKSASVGSHHYDYNRIAYLEIRNLGYNTIITIERGPRLWSWWRTRSQGTMTRWQTGTVKCPLIECKAKILCSPSSRIQNLRRNYRVNRRGRGQDAKGQ